MGPRLLGSAHVRGGGCMYVTRLHLWKGRPQAKGVRPVCGLGFKGMSSQSRTEIGLHVRASRISPCAFARCICSGLQVKSFPCKGSSARGAQIFFFLPTSASGTHDESARVWHAALSHRDGISVKCRVRHACLMCAPCHAHTPTMLGWRGSYLSCHPEGRVAQELMGAYEERLRTTDRLGATESKQNTTISRS